MLITSFLSSFGEFRSLVESDRPYACLYRPLSDESNSILLLGGDITHGQSLSSVAFDKLEGASDANNKFEFKQLVILPFNQIKEKGYVCHDDKEPIITMHITLQESCGVKAFTDEVEILNVDAKDVHYDVDDASYCDMVRGVVENEIGEGEGSNFVISRSLEGEFINFTHLHAFSIFKNLLGRERGAYWSWLIYTGDRYFIGSSPEQHIKIRDNEVSMNPISGTLVYPPKEDELEHALYGFLQDAKERDELFMVVDEELKMMSSICHCGISIAGPKLKMMSHIAHTEYIITGLSLLTQQQILLKSLYAPTVTGSPIESACKVIAKVEKRGRGFYSGVVALTGYNYDKRYLDSAILIRAIVISKNGMFRLTSGASIVRGSVPQKEAEETRAKLNGLLNSFSGLNKPEAKVISQDIFDRANALLIARNQYISTFWLGHDHEIQELKMQKKHFALIDMEDNFTGMIAYQLTAMGHSVEILPWISAKTHLARFSEPDDKTILMIGPGPGDPTNIKDEKISVARTLIAQRLQKKLPLMGTCLGHQLICVELGLAVSRLKKTRQGSQSIVELNNESYRVGFYNSFSATHTLQNFYSFAYKRKFSLERLENNEVVGLHANGVASIQFHNESFLTQNSFPIYSWLIDKATRPYVALRSRKKD